MNAWLQFAKFHFGLKSYIWKAEPQKRGVIHIHLTADVFMHHREVRDSWNRLLKKNGLLNGHENPNSIDIHSTYKIKNMSAYLCKYYCKDDDDRRIIGGRLWSCSHSLSKARGIRFEMKGRESMSELKSLRAESRGGIQKDYCEILFQHNNYLKLLPECRMKEIYRGRVKQIRSRKDYEQTEMRYTNGELISNPIELVEVQKKYYTFVQTEIF